MVLGGDRKGIAAAVDTPAADFESGKLDVGRFLADKPVAGIVAQREQDCRILRDVLALGAGHSCDTRESHVLLLPPAVDGFSLPESDSQQEYKH